MTASPQTAAPLPLNTALWIGHTLLALFIFPLSGAGLGDTEAYYSAWSLDPQWGYHDHPAVLPWLLHLTRSILPPSLPPETLRLVPCLSLLICSHTLLIFWNHAHQRQPNHQPHTLLWATLLFWATPIYATGGLMIAPDAPLAAIWALTLLATQRAQTFTRWIFVSLCCGLALATKWLALPLCAAVAFEAYHNAPTPTQRVLRPTTVAVGSSLGLLPQLIFEAQHNWTGLRYHILERHSGNQPFDPAHILAAIGGQLLALSPLLCIALFALLATHSRTPHTLLKHHPTQQALRLTLLPLLPLLAITLFTRESEPHWPSLAFLPALGLITLQWPPHQHPWIQRAILLGITLQAALWLHVATPIAVSYASDSYIPRYDVVNDLFGWKTTAERVRIHMRTHSTPRIASYHYTMCGQLAARIQPLSHISCLSRRRDAFDFLLNGQTGRAKPGEHLLYIRDNRYDEPPQMRIACSSFEHLETIHIRRAERIVHTFHISLCKHFQSTLPSSPELNLPRPFQRRLHPPLPPPPPPPLSPRTPPRPLLPPR